MKKRIKKNGKVMKQNRSLAEMAEFENPSIEYMDLDKICGIWYSNWLFLTLLIYKDHSVYKVAILQKGTEYIDVEICPVEIDPKGWCITSSEGKTLLSYNPVDRSLNLMTFGIFYRKP